MEALEKIKELTNEDRFLVCVSVLKDGKIKTNCSTNKFPYTDIKVSLQDIVDNVKKISKKSVSPKPSSLE